MSALVHISIGLLSGAAVLGLLAVEAWWLRRLGNKR